ncbi:MAG: 7-cyano-7-deazaguanine synthase [Chloroflexi bacterium]|nr:7-cyano-7-deazaguanine synthase [Chloroflexota bacterium]
MGTRPYRFVFDSIAAKLGRVQMFSPGSSAPRDLSVAVDDASFFHRLCSWIPEQVADMVDIAVAVSVVDRLAVRRENDMCIIDVDLPVWQPQLWWQLQDDYLKDLLFWYTGDQWNLNFKLRQDIGRISERQGLISDAGDHGDQLEVALWSGGLDSFAGLDCRLRSEPARRYELVGTGENTVIQNKQSQIANSLCARYFHRVKYIPISIRKDGTGRLPKSSSQRSRGFVFIALGSAYAYLKKQRILYIYENGIGAINLPYRMSEVGLDHARSVHPVTLLDMSRFVSHLFGEDFRIVNPFLYQTKAEMCKALAGSESETIALQTVSCDHLHRGRYPQCGYCTSCLLRRQALAAAGIRDVTPYRITSDKQGIGDHQRYLAQVNLSAMLHQAKILRRCMNSKDPWHQLVEQYPQLSAIADRLSKHEGEPLQQIIDRVCRLYYSYVVEWEAVAGDVGRGLLDNCTVA